MTSPRFLGQKSHRFRRRRVGNGAHLGSRGPRLWRREVLTCHLRGSLGYYMGITMLNSSGIPIDLEHLDYFPYIGYNYGSFKKNSGFSHQKW